MLSFIYQFNRALQLTEISGAPQRNSVWH